jgi:nicotinamidase-related amidase
MKSALLVIDAQQSFTRRPYWAEADVPRFVASVQLLVNRFRAHGSPILQVFHAEEDEGPSGPFSKHSGYVKAMPQFDIVPTAVFYKSVHSAMFGATADGENMHDWLKRNGVGRLVISGIRTEQCCETTTRHASDLGYSVTYVTEATLTFPMVSGSGRLYTAADIADRTELVLAGRFAQISRAEAVTL